MLFFVLFRVVWMDGVRHVRADEERFREALFDDITLSSTAVTTVATVTTQSRTFNGFNHNRTAAAACRYGSNFLVIK